MELRAGRMHAFMVGYSGGGAGKPAAVSVKLAWYRGFFACRVFSREIVEVRLANVCVIQTNSFASSVLGAHARQEV
jgi:hypothetical protein